MNEPGYGVALFQSTHWAIRAEKITRDAGLEVKLIPTPRHLSSNCGTALRFRWGDRDELVRVLEEHGLAPDGIHRI